MTLEHMIAFNIALLAAIASPGPAMLVSIRTTLVAGRMSGIAVGLGLALMACTWTLLALLGLDGIFRLFPWAYTATKLLGACYLLYIAYQTWRGAKEALRDNKRVANRAFLDGILINLSNPKSALFAAAVLIVIFPPDTTYAEKALIVTNHFIVEVICYTAFAFAFSTNIVRERYLKAKTYLDRFAAIVLSALGVRLLWPER